MPVQYSQLEQLLKDIQFMIQRLQSEIKISGNQIFVPAGLSDISKLLGLITAGEFRAGNGVEPGKGFTGTRQKYPPMPYGSGTYHFASVNNDILQVGINAVTGELTAGGGTVILNASGLFAGYLTGQYFQFDIVTGVRIVGDFIQAPVLPMGLNRWLIDVVGTCNGSNSMFIIPGQAIEDTVLVNLNGVWLFNDAFSFSLAGSENKQFTMMYDAYESGDVVTMNYTKRSDHSRIYNEYPSHIHVGILTKFETAYEYVGGSLEVFVNGVSVKIGQDYIEGYAYNSFGVDTSGNEYEDGMTVLNITQPAENALAGDNLRVCYQTIEDDNWVYYTVPTGNIDGSNMTFTMPHNYESGTLNILLNGIRLCSNDYTESSANTFTLDEAPLSGDKIWVHSKKA